LRVLVHDAVHERDGVFAELRAVGAGNMCTVHDPVGVVSAVTSSRMFASATSSPKGSTRKSERIAMVGQVRKDTRMRSGAVEEALARPKATSGVLARSPPLPLLPRNARFYGS
jgi:hypothetical protein